MAAALTGQCLCGAVAITLTGAAPTVEICQCTMCRRWGGAFYAAQTAEATEVTGEDYAAIHRSSRWAERAFCRECGSALWFRFLPTGNRSFSAGLFDGAAGHAIKREIFAEETAGWCRLAGDHTRLSGAEIIAEAEAAGFIRNEESNSNPGGDLPDRRVHGDPGRRFRGSGTIGQCAAGAAGRGLGRARAAIG